MKQKNNIFFGIIIGVIMASIGIGIGMEYHKKNHTQQESLANSGLEERTLIVGDTVLQVEVAQTTEQRMTGLSYRSSLAESRGMFFIFENDGIHGIWMKEMQFPIDVVWIDAAMKVLHIERSVAPNTYPKQFAPPTPARYVLEVPAGYTKGRIIVGETLLIK